MTSAHRLHRLSALAALLGALAQGVVADAASTRKVVALGDVAPGGGVFAGPAFTTWPGAGGSGWVAFRTRLEGASASEALVLARLTPPLARMTVAQIGDATPAGRKLRAFVGRPAVNANGDVAFLATLASRDDDPADGPAPAAVLLFRRTPPPGEPALLAQGVSGDVLAEGTLDLAGDVDPASDSTTLDVPGRGPSLNAAGTVAFITVLRRSGAPIVALCTAAGGTVTARVRSGDAFGGGEITRLGPPALNASGALAFMATTDGPNATAGIFTLDAGGLVERVKRGDTLPVDFGTVLGFPKQDPQPLVDFGDVVSLGDDGTVAFTAGPIFDKSRDDAVGGPAVIAFAGNTIHPVLHPGQRVGGNLEDRVKGIILGNAGAFATAPPVVASDGSIVAAASLNGGSVEAVLRATPPAFDGPTRLATTNGFTADQSPAGGRYIGLASGPVADADGGVAFRVRIAGGASSEAIVYRPATGASQGVFVGEGAPTDGFFAGSPFSTPRLNDRGDVVFRGYVAGGPSSVGLFKASGRGVEALVRSGDPSPLGRDFPFVDFPGDPSLNANGAVAFSASVLDQGRGVFLVDQDGVHVIVRANQAAPGGGVFRTFGSSPTLNDAGAVAFRASVRVDDETIEGVFLATPSSLHALASTSQASPAGPPFLDMSDPIVTGVPSLVFAARVGTETARINGIFTADATGVQMLASDRQILGAGLSIGDISSGPTLDAQGNLAFLGTRTGPSGSLGPAILRRSGRAIDVLLARGDAGPAGGVVKSLSQPTMNRAGHVAFRSSYETGSGASTGFLLATGTGLAPLISVGDAAAGGGRIASLQPRAALNADDTLALSATLRKAPQHTAILLASATQLSVPTLKLDLSPRPRRDRLRLALRFVAGRLSDGFDPAADPLVVRLLDTNGEVWSATIDAGALQKRGSVLVAPRRRRPRTVRTLRLQPFAGGVMRLDVRAVRVDLTNRGARRLAPPFTVAVELGDDTGALRVPCTLRLNGTACSAP